jgi:putative oxidoreductase
MALFGKLGNYKNFGLLIIRIGLGIMFILHGYPKLLGGPHRWEEIGSATNYVGIRFWPLFWGFMAAITEAIGGVLLIIGWQFRLVCLLMVINLIVAAVLTYNTGGINDASHAIEDAVVFAGLLFLGPGKYSADKK